MFPASFHGRVTITAVTDPAVALDRIAARLRDDGITKYQIIGSTLTFHVGLFGAAGKSPSLFLITSGTVRASPSGSALELHFDVSLIQAVWMVTAMAVLFGAFATKSAGADPIEILLTVLGIWSWLYGMNLLLTWTRFRRWLETAASRAPSHVTAAPAEPPDPVRSRRLTLVARAGAVLSAVGLVLSALVHLSAVMGAASPLGEAAWGLHVGIFVVWAPAVYLAKRLCGNVGQKEYWATVLRGCPTWIKYLTYALFGYAMINFALFAARAAGGHENDVIALRGFSGHWMAFYCAAMAIHVSYLNRAS